MPFYDKAPKRTHNGNELVELTVQSQLLKIRDEIESGEVIAGDKLELAYQAYTEIKNAHGHQVRKLDKSCGSCINEMLLLLRNWFKKYDQRPYKPSVKTDRVSKPLKPKAQTERKKEPSYKELLDKFNAVATTEEKKTINNGKPPKKAQIVDYFNPSK